MNIENFSVWLAMLFLVVVVVLGAYAVYEQETRELSESEMEQASLLCKAQGGIPKFSFNPRNGKSKSFLLPVKANDTDYY